MSKIVPFLWFNNNAEEAVNFYTSIFKDSKIKKVARYGEAGPGPKGSVMTLEFELNGQPFLALNGGPQYTFNPAISFVVPCETQEEIDSYWSKLTAGGEEVQCGWLRDKYGISWQIVPAAIGEIMSSPDTEKVKRAMQVMFTMKKLDIKKLREAFEGKQAAGA